MAFLDKQKNIETEAFIALLIDDESVQAGIWRIENGKTKVISIGDKQGWEGEKTKDLSESIEVSLSAAVSKLTEAGFEEPEKVILGLPPAWTEKGKITEEKLNLLKELSSRLSLKPMGFVVTPEALIHFLKVEEGAPVSAILIGLDSKEIQVNLVQIGKILGVENVARSDNLALDVEEGLLRFPNEEPFPPRMILYGEGDLESARQTLLSYPWQEPERKLPFLHFPRVEIAARDFEINALCLAGGTEIAKTEELVSEEGQRGGAEEAETRKEIPDEKPGNTEALKIKGDEEQPDLGFVVGKDVLTMKDIKDIEETKGTKDEIMPDEKTAITEAREHKDAEEVETRREKEKVEQIEKVEEVKKVKSFLSRLSLPKLGLPAFAFRPSKLVLAGIFLVILGGLFWLYKTVPKAQVTIFVSPQELKEEFELTLDPNVVVWDEKEKILPASTIEISVSQSKTIRTSGKKTVGEKAKGEVTIYNRTDDKKSFTAEAVLVGPGGLKFTLDTDVSVASKTPDLISGVDKWGEAKVGVTAASIGAEYNLAIDSQFSFEDFSSSLYLAKNTTPFSGGTSRQVQVVSEEDRVSLKKDLERQLTDKAKQEIRGKVSGDQYFIEQSLQTEISQETYSRKVGEEAQELNSDLTVKARGLTFEKSALEDFLRLLLQDKIKDYDFRWDEAHLGFEVLAVNKDKSISFKVNLAGKLYPALSADEISHNLAGKSFDFQKNYLDNLPKVRGFETKIIPAFFTRFCRLPSLKKNIKVEIKAE